MWQDPIVAETRALRDEYASQFNDDIDAMFEDLMAKQAKHPELIVSFPPRQPIAKPLGTEHQSPGIGHRSRARTTST
ncbi:MULTISPECIES: hypothetical protein [unclassified Thiocapsa]|uniref:hypothetical protein n=1 Tax=unclassified Thiocapsa TaxID=2641286 RepID=UPI0035B4EE54